MTFRRGLVGAAFAAGVVLMSAGSAAAAGSTVVIGDQAELVTSDMVEVPLTYVCTLGNSSTPTGSTFTTLGVSLQQSHRGFTLGSAATDDLLCNGSPQAVTLVVSRSLGPGYKQGQAFAETTLRECEQNVVTNQFTCTEAVDSGHVQVRR